MEKKSVFITGAANGIGKAAAYQFIQNGWFVGLYDLDEEGLETLSNELGKENCCYKKTDITSEEDLKASVDQFLSFTNGRMDVLLANAGIIVQMPFDESTPKAYKKLIEVNSFGTVNTIMQSLTALKNTECSRIVITSSSSGMFGIPHFAVYSATKAFLKSITESLSTEFANYNIGVSSVMPLFVKTNMMNDIESKYKALLTPENIARVIYVAATKGKKRHYLVGKNLRLMDFLRRALPTKAFQKVLKIYLKV